MSQTNHLVMDGKDIIEIVIEPCGIPISYRGAYYYRSGATKQELRGAALHQFLMKKSGMNWADIPCDGAILHDIDDKAVAYFLNHAIETVSFSINFVASLLRQTPSATLTETLPNVITINIIILYTHENYSRNR